MGRGGVLAAAAAFLLTGGAGLPGLGATDPRTTVDISAMPWAAFARLQIPGVSRCTAFLVGPQLVATAAHCLYSVRLGRFVPAQSVHVLIGYHLGDYTSHSVATSYDIASGYDPLRPSQSRGADLALVRLAAPVASPDRVLDLATAETPPGTLLMLGGYEQDRAERLIADPACAAHGYGLAPQRQAMLLHDCAATSGSSGAPVLQRGTDGRWIVAGVQVAAAASGASGAAVPAFAVRRMMAQP